MFGTVAAMRGRQYDRRMIQSLPIRRLSLAPFATTTTPLHMPQQYYCIRRRTSSAGSCRCFGTPGLRPTPPPPPTIRRHPSHTIATRTVPFSNGYPPYSVARWASTRTTTNNNNDNTLSSLPPPVLLPPTQFAVVHHREAYETAMAGSHGHQLALARLEGDGKDEPDFDPFLEEELEEARLLLLAEQQQERQGGGGGGGGNGKEEDDQMDNDENVNEEEDDLESNNNKESMTLDPSSPLAQHKRNRKKFNNDGSWKRNASETAILRAGSPAGGKVAIIALAGSQFKVTTDDVLIVNRLKPVSVFSVGSIQTLTNEQVLLVTSSAMTLVGMPYVSGAQVDVLVEEITQDAKVVIFKLRRRKNSKRKTGFRRDVTMLRILDIRFPPEYDDHAHAERPDPAPLIPN